MSVKEDLTSETFPSGSYGLGRGNNWLLSECYINTLSITSHTTLRGSLRAAVFSAEPIAVQCNETALITVQCDAFALTLAGQDLHKRAV
jgi:hypothetical protein